MESGLDHWPNASAFILIPMKVSVMELECTLVEKPFLSGSVSFCWYAGKRDGWVFFVVFLWVWTSARCDINIRKLVWRTKMSTGTQLGALVSWPFVDVASNGPRVRFVWNLLELSRTHHNTGPDL